MADFLNESSLSKVPWNWLARNNSTQRHLSSSGWTRSVKPVGATESTSSGMHFHFTPPHAALYCYQYKRRSIPHFWLLEPYFFPLLPIAMWGQDEWTDRNAIVETKDYLLHANGNYWRKLAYLPEKLICHQRCFKVVWNQSTHN